VVLPNHLHCILSLPVGDDNCSVRWRQIKSAFSRQLLSIEYRTNSRIKTGERSIWQRRFWKQVLCDELDYRQHVDYVHYNQVKHGYVKRVVDWEYSSFHRAVARGIYLFSLKKNLYLTTFWALPKNDLTNGSQF